MKNSDSFLHYLFYFLLAVVFLLPFERIGSFTIGGLNIRISQMLVVLVLFLFILYSLYKKSFKIVIPYSLVVYTVFLCVAMLSLISAREKMVGVMVVMFLVFMFFVPFVFVNIIDSKQRLKTACWFFLASSFVFCVFGFFQFFGDIVGLPSSVTGLSYRYVGKVLGFPRIQSTFIEPLYFANYLMIPLVVSLFFLIRRVDIKKNRYLVVVFFISLVCIALTFSKGAVAATILVFLGIFIFQLRSIFNRKNLPYIFVLSILLVSLSWAVLSTLRSSPNFDKGFEKAYDIITGASVTERQEAYSVALEAFNRKPVLGIGIGNFGPYFSGYPVSAPDFGWPIVNNQYLEILAETGIVGFLVFLVFLGLIFYRSVLAYLNTDDRFLKTFSLASLFVFAGILIQYMTFSTLYIMHIWVLIGLMLASQEIILKKENADD